MKRIAVLVVLGLLFSVAFACGASATTTSGGAFVPPPNAQLERFPIMKGPLSTTQMAQMELRPVYLAEPLLAHNYVRGWGAWVVYQIHEGTLVLVDEEGEVRYKADCGNRVAIFAPYSEELLPVVEEEGTPLVGASTLTEKKWHETLWPLLKAIALLVLIVFMIALISALWSTRKRRETDADPASMPAPTPASVGPQNNEREREVAMISIVPSVGEVGIRLNPPAVRAEVRKYGAEHTVFIYS